MESKEYLLGELSQIEAWEDDQKGLWFWERLGRLPFVFLDKLTPKVLHEKVGQVVDELGSYIQTGGQYLIREKNIYKQFDKLKKLEEPIESHDQIAALPVEIMDQAVLGISESRKKMAFMQGATTGIGGLFTLTIDIPALLGLSLKTLQEIALCYGYDPKEKEERIFIIKCMQFASSDIVGKKAIIEELAAYHTDYEKSSVVSQLQGWREVITTYRDNFGWKKLFQMIPVAGMVFGAFINKSTVQDVAEAGMMLYKKRRVMERLNALEEESIL